MAMIGTVAGTAAPFAAATPAFLPILGIGAGIAAAQGLLARRREQQARLDAMAKDYPPMGMAPPQRGPGQVPSPPPSMPMYPSAPMYPSTPRQDRSGLASSMMLPMASGIMSNPEVLDRLLNPQARYDPNSGNWNPGSGGFPEATTGK